MQKSMYIDIGRGLEGSTMQPPHPTPQMYIGTRKNMYFLMRHEFRSVKWCKIRKSHKKRLDLEHSWLEVIA